MPTIHWTWGRFEKNLISYAVWFLLLAGAFGVAFLSKWLHDGYFW